jgi:hypothetical protein
MFDYYKAWDKYATTEDDKNDLNNDDDDLIEAKNPEALPEK